MKYKITEEQEIIYPTYERIERLKQAEIDTDGQIDQLKQIMLKNALKLPRKENEGFRFELQDENNKRYIFIYQTEVDAIAEKILILIKEGNQIK